MFLYLNEKINHKIILQPIYFFYFRTAKKKNTLHNAFIEEEAHQKEPTIKTATNAQSYKRILTGKMKLPSRDNDPNKNNKLHSFYIHSIRGSTRIKKWSKLNGTISIGLLLFRIAIIDNTN